MIIDKQLMRLHAETGDSIVDPNVAKYVGLSLIIGFTVMLVLDQSFLILKEY